MAQQFKVSPAAAVEQKLHEIKDPSDVILSAKRKVKELIEANQKAKKLVQTEQTEEDKSLVDRNNKALDEQVSGLLLAEVDAIRKNSRTSWLFDNADTKALLDTVGVSKTNILDNATHAHLVEAFNHAQVAARFAPSAQAINGTSAEFVRKELNKIKTSQVKNGTALKEDIREILHSGSHLNVVPNDELADRVQDDRLPEEKAKAAFRAGYNTGWAPKASLETMEAIGQDVAKTALDNYRQNIKNKSRFHIAPTAAVEQAKAEAAKVEEEQQQQQAPAASPGRR